MLVPHYDDAVLSLGTMLNLWARTKSIHVATCFGRGIPVSTPFDRASGFEDGVEACRARWIENEDALNLLGVTSTSAGPFVDAQYDEPAELTDIIGWATSLIATLDPLAVVTLLGLHHPDHLQLAAAVACCDSAVYDRFVAEDLPYRVLFPQEVPPALERCNCTSMVSEVAASDVKAAAVQHYGSQLWSLSIPTVLCPERLWRAD